MARIGLEENRKFRRLVKRLDLPEPYVLGLLEMMWRTAQTALDPVLGDAVDVECAAKWPGQEGVFFEAIRSDWLDEQKVGVFAIHDFWDHAPDFVAKRYRREQDRLKKIANEHYIIEDGAERRRTADNVTKTLVTDCLPRDGMGGEGLAGPVTADERTEAPARPPIGKAMAEEAEIERRLSRYTSSPSDEDDRVVLRRVLTHLTSDRLTGKPLPHHRRLKVLDALERFQPGVVFIACHDFVDEGHIESGKDPTYFIAMCEKSATSKYIEFKREEEKANVEPQKKTGNEGTNTTRKAGDILASALGRGVQPVDA